MLHHPSGGARGQAADLHNEARELMRLRTYVNRVLADATGQPVERVSDFSLKISMIVRKSQGNAISPPTELLLPQACALHAAQGVLLSQTASQRKQSL